MDAEKRLLKVAEVKGEKVTKLQKETQVKNLKLATPQGTQKSISFVTALL